MKKGIKEITQKISASVLATIMMFSVFSTTISLVLPKTVYAADNSENTYTINGSEHRDNGAGTGNFVYYGSHKVWDYFVGKNGGTTTDRHDEYGDYDYYCLRGNTNINSWYPNPGYTQIRLMDDNGTKDRSPKDILVEIASTGNESNIVFSGSNDEERKKSVVSVQWLAKNMYEESTQCDDDKDSFMREHLLKIINKYAGNNNKVTTIEHLNSEQIGVVQQYVVWQFVEPNDNSEYYKNAIKNKDSFDKFTYTSLIGSSSNKYFKDDNQKKEAYAIYVSLVKGATEYAKDKNSNITLKNVNNEDLQESYKMQSKTYENGLKINEVSGKENTYRIKVNISSRNEEWQNSISKITDTLTVNGTEITSKKYYIGNTEYNNPPKGGEYEIEFVVNELGDTPKIGYNAEITHNTMFESVNSYIYVRGQDNGYNKQPILGYTKDLIRPEASTNVDITEKFPEQIDLALTKQIIEIKTPTGENTYKTTNVIDRLKRINDNENSTTREYIMKKKPITVNRDDKITYKIAVYNEGESDGYLREIKDYYQQGLEYDGYCAIGSVYTPANQGESLMSIGDTTDTGLTTVNTEGDNVLKIKVGSDATGIKLKSKEAINIIVRFKVGGNIGPGCILINMAEISSYGSETKDASEQKVDIDSIQDNSINEDNKRKNYITKINKILNQDKKHECFDKQKFCGYEEDDYDFDQVKVGEFDLALRKFITKVGEQQINNRTPEVTRKDLYNLKTYQNITTLDYKHKKSPVLVEKGQEVTYTLRIYNEGFIDGYVKKITDYLPDGLEYVTIKTSGWTGSESSEGKVVISCEDTDGCMIDALKNSIKPEDLHFIDIEIQCRVKDDVTDGKVLTNVAEITDYGFKSGTHYNPANGNNVDRDSEMDTVFSTNEDVNTVEKYYNNQDVKTDKVLYKGIEDDDDFENIKVTPFDLALRKFITTVDGKNLDKSREPIINDASYSKLTNDGTAAYWHEKDPITVSTGKNIVYTLRVYNEGYIDGKAKEITDFLPKGLEFVENSELNNANGWVATKNEDGTTTVKTEKLKDTVIKAGRGSAARYKKFAQNGTMPEENESFWRDVQIECKVTSEINDEVLTNVAEITKYGHGDKEASEKGVDVDSEQGNVFSLDDSINNIQSYLNSKDLKDANRMTKINGVDTIDVPGLQDDDDFESVKVEKITGAYSINLIKTDKNNKPLKDVEFTATVKKGNNDAKLTDTNGNEIKIDKLVTDSEGKISISNINITEVGEYVIEFTETKVPEGYVMLESPIKVTYKTKMSNGQYSLESNPTISGDASVTANSNSITIRVQNGQFDLALRKFITAVRKSDKSKEEITSRIPVFKIDENGKYIYEHTKEPVTLGSRNIVEYTLRVYNEGQIDGYAKEIKDDIPDGLEFLPNDDLNKEYNWKMINEEGNVVENVSEAKYIVTDYLSKEKETEADKNLLKAFDLEAYNAGTIKEPDYKEVKVAFKVIIPNSDNRIIINQAQISDDSDKDGNDVTDKDSTPDKWIEGEDDQDIEKVKVLEFDLALRKFITGVKTGVGTNDEKKQEITNRIPQFKVDENGKYIYEHTKEPVTLGNQNVVEYTLRVYNEGQIDGYAKEIKDDIPDGLEFLPNDDINKEYNWKMINEEGNAVENVNEAKYIVTDYLSKEKETEAGTNLLKAFDLNAYKAGTIKEPNYKEVKVAFKVTIPNSDNRIIINQAQISDDSDKDGNDITDKDSTPDKWIEGEDDQDIEKVKVLEFDLALRKWVTKAIVIEKGKQTVTETGHKAEDDPEDIVKLDFKKSAIKNLVVKYEYKIRVTNEGEIAGYAKEISDYIPEGLRFEAADNPLWEEVEGKVVTDQLKDTLLQPGESAEVSIILTWINREDNMGLKVNVAEISKDYNEYGTPDRDSTPNNKVPGEDDIDDAPVMLTVKTGQTVFFIGTTLIALNILCAGVVVIKKII